MKVDMNVGNFLDRAALVFPDRIALVDEESAPGNLGRITYGELNRRAMGMAKAFDEMGVAQGERIALISPNSGKFLVSYYGVSGYGRVLVPINYRLSEDELAYIVGHSGSTVLMVDPEYEEMAKRIKVQHLFVLDNVHDKELFAPLSDSSPGPKSWDADEDFTCSINYTSGTTARPKGVQMTHRNAWINAVIFGWHTGVDDRDVLLHTLPMFHCNGWGMPYAVTAMGGTHVIQRKIDGENILQKIENEGVTLLCGAPAVWASVLDAATKRSEEGRGNPGRDLVRVVAAGAPPPSRTIERIEGELGWEFIQLYGLTETSPLLTINRATKEWDVLDQVEKSKRLSWAGVPAIGIEVCCDNSGEVLARGNHIFAGYWENPEATGEALAGGWFHTGDGGHMEGPYLVISDRKKDVIISGGENVSSVEVEDVLYQHPAVAEVAVIGVPDEKWGETVKALVVLRPKSEVTEGELRAFCKTRLAGFKCPTTIEFRDALARTATGKLQKFKLREPYWNGFERKIN
ncbi:MAG: AMP-binding protein [Actinomycetota bacterium]|nr:AMP-binding protein [Actinomycetota bacterium]